MNTITTLTRHFPEGHIGVVHQDGTKLTEPTKGFHIHLHTREGEETPCSAEIDGDSMMDHYAEIGLWFEGKELSDYDGVFSLPKALIVLLRELGFTVAEDSE